MLIVGIQIFVGVFLVSLKNTKMFCEKDNGKLSNLFLLANVYNSCFNKSVLID